MSGETEFEQKRREQIKRNQQFLKDLGLVEEAKVQPLSNKKPRSQLKKRSQPIERPIPRKRLPRGQTEDIQTTLQTTREVDIPAPVEYFDWSKATISTPFTIRSTQTTIWSLGTLVMDPLYWSTSGVSKINKV